MNKAMKRLLLATAVLLSSWTLPAQFRTQDYADLYDSETVTALKGHVSMLAGAQMKAARPARKGSG